MNDRQLRIIISACKIRMARGEDLEDILASYPKLTEDEKAKIRRELGG